jgi:hypothetical protein
MTDETTMTQFERTAFGVDRPQDRTNVYVTRRKDGKYKAVYAFYGRQITKIRTREQLKADHNSGGYRMVGVDAMDVI